jgi:hypothetical protein
MTQEALKLALEALITITDAIYVNSQQEADAVYKANDAVKAIKEALAQEQAPVAWVSEDVCEGQYINGRPRKIWWECEKGVGTAFYTHPPQRTEQEPVAIKRMKEWIEYLKRKSDFGQHMKIPSEMSAGTCWELAIELEQFINTTPPQRTEQELIAYLYNMGYKAGHHDTLEGTYIDIFRQDMSTYHSDVVSEWLEDEGYTTPPQRTWVGLTDEEIDLVCVGLWSGGWRKKAMQDFAKVIEAKLKQVNGYAEEKNT